MTSGNANNYALADLYAVDVALPPRYRPRTVWFGNKSQYNKSQQFNSTLQAARAIWLPLAQSGVFDLDEKGSTGFSLIGYPANESSAMTTAITTGSKVLALGDPRYFVIVDRIGIDLEVVDSLFGSNLRPSGQRGLLAF